MESCRVWTPANWMPCSGWYNSQPVRWLRKSKCHQERRNSPSVASFRPIEACLCTTFSISRSSALRRSSAVISPFSSLARASLMRGGRNRLPTSSARNGALVLCMVFNPNYRFALPAARNGLLIFRRTSAFSFYGLDLGESFDLLFVHFAYSLVYDYSI